MSFIQHLVKSSRSRVTGVRISEFLQLLYDLEQTFSLWRLALVTPSPNEGIGLDHP